MSNSEIIIAFKFVMVFTMLNFPYLFLMGKFYYLYYYHGEIRTRDYELNTVPDPHNTF